MYRYLFTGVASLMARVGRANLAITRGEGRLLSLVVAEASASALRTLHDCRFLLACDDVLIVLTPHTPYCWLRNARFSGVKAPTLDRACNASIAWTKNRKIATSVAIAEDRLNFIGSLEPLNRSA